MPERRAMSSDVSGRRDPANPCGTPDTALTMRIFWHGILLDDRPATADRRWPTWTPDRGFLHRTGRVAFRNGGGHDVLVGERPFIELRNSLKLEPSSNSAPISGKVADLVRRFYPLDRDNRAFALSVSFALRPHQFWDCEIDSVKLDSPPVFETWNPPYSPNLTTCEDLAAWVVDLRFKLRGRLVLLGNLGTSMARHLGEVTGDAAGPPLQSLGSALWFDTSLRFAPDFRANPSCVVTRADAVRRRPWLFTANRFPSRPQRRLRLYLLRSFAEAEIARFILDQFPEHDERPDWAGRRLHQSLALLERHRPYGESPDALKRLYYQSIGGADRSFGAHRQEILSRLKIELTPLRGYSASTIAFGDDVYDVLAELDPKRHPYGANAQLVAELQCLRDRLADDPASADALEKAIDAARAGDERETKSRLRRVSREVLRTARELGTEVAAAAISKSLGI